MNERQKILYKVLLMPIIEKDIREYQIEEDIIYSGFSYGNDFDADMSNVAVKFYSILYGVDEEEIVSNSNRYLKGDTMNASSPYYKPSIEKTSEWNRKKHCLANFWLLPMDIGRTPVKHLSDHKRLLCKHSKKSKLHDYMDKFLTFMNDNITDYYDEYKEYFESIHVEITSFSESFSKVHYLRDGYYFENKVKLIKKEQLKYGYDVWERIIETRAYEIAVSDKWEKLYKHLVVGKYKTNEE